ncbi:MAG: TrmH family RNA methyltransferase [Defluviitaleaceae bacterium]|nr:TrmH family RNA methyltransferase [Defluviitaleaceae bacterium]
MKNAIKPYKKDSQHSYASGAYAVIELLYTRPEIVESVVIHSSYRDTDGLLELCRMKSVEVLKDDRMFKRINQKENTYVLALFSKYDCKLSDSAPHVVLVNPSDMGNLGSVIRTLAGVNITNLAIITPAADIWNPKTIRASMGALFRLEIVQYDSIEAYRDFFKTHKLYPFMLDGKVQLGVESCPKDVRYSLVFGNEATGLPDYYHNIGTSVKLLQSHMVDSLNLSVAVGIGSFLFASANGQI